MKTLKKIYFILVILVIFTTGCNTSSSIDDLKETIDDYSNLELKEEEKGEIKSAFLKALKEFQEKEQIVNSTIKNVVSQNLSEEVSLAIKVEKLLENKNISDFSDISFINSNEMSNVLSVNKLKVLITYDNRTFYGYYYKVIYKENRLPDLFFFDITEKKTKTVIAYVYLVDREFKLGINDVNIFIINEQNTLIKSFIKKDDKAKFVVSFEVDESDAFTYVKIIKDGYSSLVNKIEIKEKMVVDLELYMTAGIPTEVSNSTIFGTIKINDHNSVFPSPLMHGMILNNNQGQSFKITSNPDGTYKIPYLKQGLYNIEIPSVEHSFSGVVMTTKAQKIENINLRENEIANLEIVLNIDDSTYNTLKILLLDENNNIVSGIYVRDINDLTGFSKAKTVANKETLLRYVSSSPRLEIISDDYIVDGLDTLDYSQEILRINVVNKRREISFSANIDDFTLEIYDENNNLLESGNLNAFRAEIGKNYKFIATKEEFYNITKTVEIEREKSLNTIDFEFESIYRTISFSSEGLEKYDISKILINNEEIQIQNNQLKLLKDQEYHLIIKKNGYFDQVILLEKSKNDQEIEISLESDPSSIVFGSLTILANNADIKEVFINGTRYNTYIVKDSLDSFFKVDNIICEKDYEITLVPANKEKFETIIDKKINISKVNSNFRYEASFQEISSIDIDLNTNTSNVSLNFDLE